MSAPSLVERLCEALRLLPGVGPKSARRMAYYLLVRNREAAVQLGRVLIEAAERVRRCRQCRNLTESELCAICASPRRDDALVCVVESASDVHAIDEATDYSGRYFVLHGRLSPLDGVGPAEIGLDQLGAWLERGTVNELVIATNPTVEGDATAHYIAERLAAPRGIRCTRIAHGVPMGGELEFVDGGTLRHAFAGRRALDT